MVLVVVRCLLLFLLLILILINWTKTIRYTVSLVPVTVRIHCCCQNKLLYHNKQNCQHNRRLRSLLLVHHPTRWNNNDSIRFISSRHDLLFRPRQTSTFASFIAKTNEYSSTEILQKSSTTTTTTLDVNTVNSSSGSYYCKHDTGNENYDVPVVIQSNALGKICKLRLRQGQADDNDNDNSFVKAMGVPTYKCHGGNLLLQDDTTSNINEHGEEEKDLTTKTTSSYVVDCINNICSPTFVVDNVLSKTVCNDIIVTCDALIQHYNVGKNNHGAVQLIVTDEMANDIAKQIQPYIDINQVEQRRIEMIQGSYRMKQQQQQQKQQQNSNNSRVNSSQVVEESSPDDASCSTITMPTNSTSSKLVFAGINRRWRLYRYMPGGIESFAPHIDAGFPPSTVDTVFDNDNDNIEFDQFIWDVSNGTIVSRLTLLMYMNDNFYNGETIFYSVQDPTATVLATVTPTTGSCLVFPQAVGEDAVNYARIHWPLHEGSSVHVNSSQPKYVIRSDILFKQQQQQ